MPRSKNTPRVGAVADDGGAGAAFRCIAAAAAAGGSMICATGVALASNAGRGDVLGRILAPLPRGPPVGPLAGDGAAWGRGAWAWDVPIGSLREPGAQRRASPSNERHQCPARRAAGVTIWRLCRRAGGDAIGPPAVPPARIAAFLGPPSASTFHLQRSCFARASGCDVFPPGGGRAGVWGGGRRRGCTTVILRLFYAGRPKATTTGGLMWA